MNLNHIPFPLKIDDWDGNMGKRWVSHIAMFEAMLAPAGRALMKSAGFVPGETVVDIGCGGGVTTIQIAEAIGSTGHATGVDISRDIIVVARARAIGLKIENLSFICADAAASRLAQAPFDHLYSRFGTMFFADPPAAFANLRQMIRPGGRADLVTWAPPQDNAWIWQMLNVAARHVVISPTIPRAAGPFALDQPDYIDALLKSAGFTHVEIKSWSGRQPIGMIGTQPVAAAEFMLNAGPIANLTENQDDGVREAIREDLVALFESHNGPDGVTMNACAWLISARA